MKKLIITSLAACSCLVASSQLDSLVLDEKIYYYFDWEALIISNDASSENTTTSADSTVNFTHESVSLSADSGSVIVPQGAHAMVIDFQGARGGNGAFASASFSGAGGTCQGQGGSGGSALSGKLLIINIQPADTLTYELPANGINSTQTTSCSSCGTGCPFSCTAGSGTDGTTMRLKLNGELVFELSGGSGGAGGKAGTPQCTNGANGSPGAVEEIANHVIVLSSSATTSGEPSISIAF